MILAPHDDVDQVLIALADVLEQANRAAARIVDTDPAFPAHSLALGVLLVQARVGSLASAQCDLELLEAQVEDRDICDLLRTAEALTRELPLDELSGLPEVVVELCDLIREAEALA